MITFKELAIRDKVKVKGEPYTGVVRAISYIRNEAYIEWHKGYSNWVKLDNINKQEA